MSAVRLARLVIAVAVISAVAGGAWWRFGRGVEVSAVLPTRGTAVEIVYATGAVEPVRWANTNGLPF